MLEAWVAHLAGARGHADQIKHLDSARCTFTILMSPRVTTLCTQALKDDGVFGTVDIQAFPLELVPLEKDVLSLEYPDSYAAMYQVSLRL